MTLSDAVYGFEGEMILMLEKTTHMNLLYDFYQNLLTERQRKYMEYYYHDDLSLSEIAEQFQVSRQAVFENLKRAEQLLEQYESHLQLLAKHDQRARIIDELDELLHESSEIKVDQVRNLVTALKNVD